VLIYESFYFLGYTGVSCVSVVFYFGRGERTQSRSATPKLRDWQLVVIGRPHIVSQYFSAILKFIYPKTFG
jgi:hypothetical protein